MQKTKLLGRIFTSFFKVGALTFGGGYAMLPILEHEVADKRRWVEKTELLDYFAMGQSLPGIIAVNVATFCGSKLAGLAGAAAAVLGVICPSIIVITLIALFLGAIMDYPIVTKLLFGMNIGVSALLVASVLTMLKKAVVDVFTAVLALAAFVSVAFFGLHSLVPVVVGIATGLLLKWNRSGRKGDEK